mgnify:CR=1 FL=1
MENKTIVLTSEQYQQFIALREFLRTKHRQDYPISTTTIGGIVEFLDGLS